MYMISKINTFFNTIIFFKIKLNLNCFEKLKKLI